MMVSWRVRIAGLILQVTRQNAAGSYLARPRKLFLRRSHLNLATMATPAVIRNSSSSANILVNPTSALIDEKVSILLSGLEPGSTITLRALMEERKMTFESHAHYIADCNGQVDAAEQPAVGGSYVGIEPMGLFWSMSQSPGQRKGLRFAKLDVNTPISVKLSLHKGFKNTEALQDAESMATTEIQRWYKAENVERIPVKCGRVRGAVLKPKGNGPFPGVIDMFGNVGGLIEFRAALFASRGFATLSLPYFGYDDLPSSYIGIEMEYFQESSEWFARQPYVNPGGIGAVGVSTGGQIALTMGAFFPDTVKAVVSISSPHGHVYPPFSYKGEELPALGFDLSRWVEGEHGMVTYPGLDEIRTAPENTKIPVENIHNMLFIVGEADLNCPSLVNARDSINRLEAHGHKSYELRSYPGAGHLIEPPYSPFCRSSYHRTISALLDWGGNMVGHSRAQEDAWPRILKFLRQHLSTTNRTTSRL